MLLRRSLLGLWMLASVGCADMATGPRVSPQPGARFYTDGEADPAAPWPVRINYLNAWISMPRTTGEADIGGEIGYEAYHASLDANATLQSLRGGVTQRNYSPNEKHTWYAYSGNVHRAYFPFYVPDVCGAVLSAEVNGRAWWRGFAGGGTELVLDQQTAPRYTSEGQGDCDVRDETKSTGGGGGDGCLDCVEEPAGGYTHCVVRYWYYKDTGEIFASTTLYCF